MNTFRGVYGYFTLLRYSMIARREEGLHVGVDKKIRMLHERK